MYESPAFVVFSIKVVRRGQRHDRHVLCGISFHQEGTVTPRTTLWVTHLTCEILNFIFEIHQAELLGNFAPNQRDTRSGCHWSISCARRSGGHASGCACKYAVAWLSRCVEGQAPLTLKRSAPRCTTEETQPARTAASLSAMTASHMLARSEASVAIAMRSRYGEQTGPGRRRQGTTTGWTRIPRLLTTTSGPAKPQASRLTPHALSCPSIT